MSEVLDKIKRIPTPLESGSKSEDEKMRFKDAVLAYNIETQRLFSILRLRNSSLDGK